MFFLFFFFVKIPLDSKGAKLRVRIPCKLIIFAYTFLVAYAIKFFFFFVIFSVFSSLNEVTHDIGLVMLRHNFLEYSFKITTLDKSITA